MVPHLLPWQSIAAQITSSRAAARARGKALAVTAYDVSSGALGAFRRALVDDHGFTADGSGALGDVVAGADRVRFVLGSATAPPHAVEAALREVPAEIVRPSYAETGVPNPASPFVDVDGVEACRPKVAVATVASGCVHAPSPMAPLALQQRPCSS